MQVFVVAFSKSYTLYMLYWAIHMLYIKLMHATIYQKKKKLYSLYMYVNYISHSIQTE